VKKEPLDFISQSLENYKVMKRLLLILIPIIFSVSCQRLDDLLYDPLDPVDEYELNNLSDDRLIIDRFYLLPDSSIFQFDLETIGEDGGEETIAAIFLGDTSRIKEDTVILYCHGNTSHIDDYWGRATLLANVGAQSRYGVLIFDYQGYGKSTGIPYEEGMYQDADACLRWLESKGLTNDRLIIYGYSLGSAPTCELAANPRSMSPSKIILESPFASAERIVSDATPLDLPSDYFTNLVIDNAEEIKKINQDFLWIHGTDDRFLSREFHGQVVFDNYRGQRKEKLLVEGAGHPDVPEVLGFENYLFSIQLFIEN